MFLDPHALDDFNNNRITRILTTDFPQYFAIITRIRQEIHAIGPEGGILSSTVVPQVQAIFPEGALTKKIKVGLQVGNNLDDNNANNVKRRRILNKKFLYQTWNKLFKNRGKTIQCQSNDPANKARARYVEDTSELGINHSVSKDLCIIDNIHQFNEISSDIKNEFSDDSCPNEKCSKFEMWTLMRKNKVLFKPDKTTSDKTMQQLYLNPPVVPRNASTVTLSSQMSQFDEDSVESHSNNSHSEADDDLIELRKNNIYHILNIRTVKVHHHNGPVTRNYDLESVSKVSGNCIANRIGDRSNLDTFHTHEQQARTMKKKLKAARSPTNTNTTTGLSFVSLFFPRVNLLSHMV